MKLIVAGTRTIPETDYYLELLSKTCSMHNFHEDTVTEIISGNAKGADRLGELWGARMDIPVTLFPANWNQHGKAAGPIRNRQMAKYADVLLLLWDGKSKGSLNMKTEMLKLNKPVFEVILEKGE